MVPTVGRIVHVFPGPNRPDLCSNGLKADDPVAAVVTRVWDEGETPVINVMVLLDARDAKPVTSVSHVSEAHGGVGWDWPPRS